MSNMGSRSAASMRAVPAGQRRSAIGPAPVARIPDSLDAPTVGDHRRIRDARRKARVRAREIDAVRDAALFEAFRTEIGEVVRSASPLLISMLAIEGLTLDDAVAGLEPKSLWPSRPRLSGLKKGVPVSPHHIRYQALRPSQFMSRPPTQITQRPVVARMFDRTGGGYVELQVVDHSLEVEARIGPAWIETRFGELSIELDRQLPGTILAGCVGRLVEEIVDHQAWRGRGWRIATIAEEEYPLGERLIVATGAVDYRMPWVR